MRACGYAGSSEKFAQKVAIVRECLRYAAAVLHKAFGLKASAELQAAQYRHVSVSRHFDRNRIRRIASDPVVLATSVRSSRVENLPSAEIATLASRSRHK